MGFIRDWAFMFHRTVLSRLGFPRTQRNSVNIDRLKEILRDHEGVRNYPYEDTVGKVTIGVGRNLTDNGLSDEEVEHLLHTDVTRVLGRCLSLDYWSSLSDSRRLVVADIVFNIGFTKWSRGFVKANQAIRDKDYKKAAEEMLDSKWARQVGRRAIKLARVMETGIWDG